MVEQHLNVSFHVFFRGQGKQTKRAPRQLHARAAKRERERDNEMRERDRKGRLLSARSKTALKSRFTYKSQCASSRLKADYTQTYGERGRRRERKKETDSQRGQTNAHR